MVSDFLDQVKKYAMADERIESVILVGSYARGENRDDSDVDLCIISIDQQEMITDDDFYQRFGEVKKKQTEYYGACISVRVWYQDGLEVEFGIVEPSWILVPLDAGTRKVLSDGYRILLDKKSKFRDFPIHEIERSTKVRKI